jgi:6-phosphogluconolactonase
MKKFIEILSDQKILIERTQQIILTKIEAAIKSKDSCSIALAGGGTPKPLYESLATQNLPWNKIHIFWGDERYVPAEHTDSNQLMARQAWLDRIELPASNIHPMKINGESPAEDAALHERELREFFRITEGEFPTFDLIILGIGDDGHTASLFPHTAVLQETQKAIAVGDKSGEPRITFTVPLINQADCVLFLVAGANKRDALEQIFAADADNMAYPARLIQPQGELWWLLDETAGKLLKNRNISLAS